RAEDGIRDFHVTGVQTCALPISEEGGGRAGERMSRAYRTLLVASENGITTITMNKPERKNPLGPEMVNELCYALDDAKDDASVRSEERRVGKEGRRQWGTIAADE